MTEQVNPDSSALVNMIEEFKNNQELGGEHCECCSHRISQAMRAAFVDAFGEEVAPSTDEIEMLWEKVVLETIEELKRAVEGQALETTHGQD